MDKRFTFQENEPYDLRSVIRLVSKNIHTALFFRTQVMKTFARQNKKCLKTISF